MSDDSSTIPARPDAASGPDDRRGAWLAFLRRPGVGVALLVLFTFLVSVVSQGLFWSIDEGTQQRLARNPISDLLTHHVQDHPGYGVLAHLAMRYLPGSPIAPVRVPSFCAGLLLPLVFYLTHRRYAGHEAALLVALVLLLTDPVRFYMTVGRGYSLLMLGVMVLNYLALETLRRGGWWRGLIYVPLGVATGFVHMWALPVVGAHGLFLALEVLRRRGKGAVARRALGLIAAVAATLVLGSAVYLPMLDEIRMVAGRRGNTLMLRPVLDAVLQLPRFASWTVAVHLLLVPIFLEGFARLPLRIGRDRVAQMYLMIIAVLLAWASLVHSAYFGSRYLLGFVPGAAGLAARGLSGYWRGRGRPAGRRLPVLPRPATWAIGLASGIICANAPRAHEIPGGAVTDRLGRDSHYFYRVLAWTVGDPAAVCLLVLGIVGLVLGSRLRLRRREGALRRQEGVASAYIWTGLLLASMGPFILGPFYANKPFFELHMLAVAAVLLDAWEHRFSDRHLRALRLAFLVIAIVAVVWQANVAMPQITPGFFLGLTQYPPPVLIVLPLARTSGPAFADGHDP